MNKENKPYIEHKVIELFGLDSEFLKKSKLMLPKIRAFVDKTKLKVLKENYHDFTPYGTTIVLVLSSSHLAVHTWPEHNYLHIDLVTCAKINSDDELRIAIEEIFGIKGQNIKIREIKYG